MIAEFIVFVISLAAVLFGADWLGNAATYTAKRLGLPRIVIGATIISLATTIPEIVVAAISGASGVPELGAGTAFGSPIVNVGLVFGFLLLFSKQEVNKTSFVRTIKFLFVVLALIFLFSFTGTISPISGLILIGVGVSYLILEFAISKHEEGLLESIETRFERLINFLGARRNYQQIFNLIVGGFLLFGGGYYLTESATLLADILGVPKIIIGLLAVAFGTSLPEAFTAVYSIVKKRPSLSTGNLFGASILDLTIALGAASVFGGVRLDVGSLYLTLATITVLGVVSLYSISGKVSSRFLGGLLIVVYLGFTVWFTGLEV